MPYLIWNLKAMKIVVIGAGPAGLVSLKYALDNGCECDVFEQTGKLGGTWVYTDKIGIDEYGIPIHSSMYKGMRTNLPKELMYFLDFPYTETTVKSYISQEQVLEYLNNFANFFNLHKHIKFLKCVTLVEPDQDSRWRVRIKNLENNIDDTFVYDSVFVCNGHNHTPNIPEIPGQNLYKGIQLHSHSYRTPEPYRNKRVLVIGAGSSGVDIGEKILKCAKQVFLSFQRNNFSLNRNFMVKPIVAKLFENGAIFQDGSKEEVDAILYCTGYKYTFPFLSDACDLLLQDKWIQPLYKHIVNIKHPTMFFIGLLGEVPVFPVLDIQVKFSLAELNKKFLPPIHVMLEELNKFIERKKMKNTAHHHYFRIGSNLEKYFLELTETAKLPMVPPVISKLYLRVRMNRNYEDCFKIVDDNNFMQLN